MKRLTGFLLLLVLSIVIAGCGANNAENEETDAKNDNDDNEVMEFDLGHTLTEQSVYQVTAEEMVKASDGKLKLNIFPQSQLGSEVTMADSLIQGSLPFQFAGLTNFENMIPELQILNTPYLFDSTEQIFEILNGEVGEMISEKFEEQGLIVLGWLAAERNIFTTKKPIENLEAMKSMKLRVLQAPSYIKAYEALGAQPTAIDYGEFFMAAQQGVIDGGDAAPEQFILDKFVEIADYYNFIRMHQMPLVLLMSKKVYDDLTPEQQELIKEAAKEGLEAGQEFYYKSLEDSIEEMKEVGTQLFEPDLTEFKEAVKDVQNEIIKETPNGQEWFDKIQAAK